MTASLPHVAFVWDNFGPTHVDRCEAVNRDLSSAKTFAYEVFDASDVYDWVPEDGTTFRKKTLFPRGSWTSVRSWQVAAAIWKACRGDRITHAFLCNYDRPGIWLAAILLRLSGCRVFLMADSKFDDKPRSLAKESLKRLFFLPYHGALACGRRSRDYVRFLGIPAHRIATEYDTLSIDRIRRLAGKSPAPGGTAFDRRHFTIVARLVPKKNILMALDAYAVYCRSAREPRDLHICGSGPMEADVKARIATLGIGEKVVLHGFVQTEAVAKVLGDTLALILPSVEEQFGLVVIEAQAMGLPVIVSENCGARDELVRAGVNGFVIEPDNPEGLAFFMGALSSDRDLWHRMSQSALDGASKGDVGAFVEGVAQLVRAP